MTWFYLHFFPHYGTLIVLSLVAITFDRYSLFKIESTLFVIVTGYSNILLWNCYGLIAYQFDLWWDELENSKHDYNNSKSNDKMRVKT